MYFTFISQRLALLNSFTELGQGSLESRGFLLERKTASISGRVKVAILKFSFLKWSSLGRKSIY